MLKLRNISKYYYSKNNIVCALNHISLDFNIGEFVAITGESGSGKSTLLNVLSGLDTFEEGHLYVQDNEMSHLTIEQLETYRNQYIGFVFQDYNIIESYTVYENVMAALLLKDLTKEERVARATELIHQVGLSDQTHQKASTLSGGEKQRTVIARALAKDASLIVCDEPTGNLDDQSAKEILALLNTISKDKCVIVVTHNFEQVKPYATRKVRLYDGDVIEDQVFKDPVEHAVTQSPYTSNPSMKSLLHLSWFNLKNIPKKTGFMMIIIAFIIVAFMSVYAISLDARNTVYQDQTAYFDHVMKHRLIVTKTDRHAFDISEIEQIESLNNVIDVTEQDIVYDVLLSSAYFDPAGEETLFKHYYVYPAVTLNESQLISGRMPQNANEIVIGEDDLYAINDVISFSPRHMIKEVEGIVTDTFTKTIVGFVKAPNRIDRVNYMYFTRKGLNELESVSNYKFARVYLDIDGLRQYALTTDIQIDNDLSDGVLKTYDMLFFDICRDFGYKEEIIDDFDAGLCPVEEFLPVHDLSLSIITRFENKPNLTPITIESEPMEPSILGQTLSMNEATFNALFTDETYQLTVLVYDMYEADLVKTALEEIGYNVLYPAGVLDEADAFDVLMERIQLTLGFLTTILIVYFVGYFVLRTLTYSKQKDYIILRSIGATKKTILGIMMFEVMFLTTLSMVIVMALAYTIGYFDPMIGDYLRYFTFTNLVFMVLSIGLMMAFMVRKINHHMFKTSVITSLRVG
jgi:ABC-type lipoprotein export system ATPase subunit/ABC-type antimicrobial peptide transport system permease subunit